MSTANPIVSAVFADPSLNQEIQIVNTDAARLNYDFCCDPGPDTGGVAAFGRRFGGFRRRRVAEY